MRSAIEFIDMDREELNQLVERARASLSAEEYRKLKGVVEALSYLTDLVADQQTTIRDPKCPLMPAFARLCHLCKGGIKHIMPPDLVPEPPGS